MTLVVNVDREAELYGRPVVEKWTLRYEHNDGAVSAGAELRIEPETGSNKLYTDTSIDLRDVPDEILERAEAEAGDAGEVTGEVRAQ